MKTMKSGPAGALWLVLLAMTFAYLAVLADQGTDRSTAELEKDLRATKREYKEFKSLNAKLESAAKQSANTARETAIHKFQDFMGECIRRREKDLGAEMTIKQHGEMVRSGTTEVAEVGAPVPANNGPRGGGAYDSSNGDRLRQLDNMKSIYVASKNNSRPAIERQTHAFERYTETIGKFGRQLEWAITSLERELEQREAAKSEESGAPDQD